MHQRALQVRALYGVNRSIARLFIREDRRCRGVALHSGESG